MHNLSYSLSGIVKEESRFAHRQRDVGIGRCGNTITPSVHGSGEPTSYFFITKKLPRCILTGSVLQSRPSYYLGVTQIE